MRKGVDYDSRHLLQKSTSFDKGPVDFTYLYKIFILRKKVGSGLLTNKNICYNTLTFAEYLQQFYILQAIQKYCNGEYIFKGVEYYARIEIVIELPINYGRVQRIKTGWSLLSKGEIKMATPFSGFAN